MKKLSTNYKSTFSGRHSGAAQPNPESRAVPLESLTRHEC